MEAFVNKSIEALTPTKPEEEEKKEDKPAAPVVVEKKKPALPSVSPSHLFSVLVSSSTRPAKGSAKIKARL